MMMFSAPRLETLELLDIGAQLWVGSTLVDMLKTRSKTLRFLALRLNHRPDEVGVLDSILEVCPHLEVLHVHPDLISPRFFAQQLPSHFRILLLGSPRGSPIVFRGTDSLAALWKTAAERWPALTMKRTQAASHSIYTAGSASSHGWHPALRQDRLSTVERARAASEEATCDGFRDILDMMEQEMRSPNFVPAPLGPKETSEVAAALSD